jgi:FAD:protein FMN transferase
MPARTLDPTQHLVLLPESAAAVMRWALPLAMAACVAAATVRAPAGELVERRVILMGTALDLAVEAPDRARALAASEKAVTAVAAAEARLSTWREDTELARLNRSPVGQPMRLSPRLFAELTAAFRCAEETGGAFDPLVGPLVEAWGLRRGGRMPTPSERAAAVAAARTDGVRLAEGNAVRLRADAVLEEGGWGKGAGLSDALAALAADPVVSRATLDLGGQVAVLARDEQDDQHDAWTVPVADPRRRDRRIAELRIDGGSVATSGDSERGIVAGGRRLGHILDPRNGEPAPDFGSLTVWAGDPLTADCLSTGLYVLGPEGALSWATGHPGVEVLVLRRSLLRQGGIEALATPGLAGRLNTLDPTVRLRFTEEQTLKK